MSDLKIFTINEIQSEPVSWLWEPYIPHGKITIVQGDPGDGKTTMMLAICFVENQESQESQENHMALLTPLTLLPSGNHETEARR